MAERQGKLAADKFYSQMQVQVKEATCQMTLLIRVDNALGGAQGKMQNNWEVLPC